MKNGSDPEVITNLVDEPALEYGHEYTYADYLTFQFEEMVELIRGKIFKMSPAPKVVHQVISRNLEIEIGNLGIPHQVSSFLPVNRSYASMYFSAVLRMTSAGRLGAGGFLSQRMESR